MRKEQDYNRDLKIELEGRKKKYKFRSQFGFTNINYIKIVVEKERMGNTIYIPLFTCIQQNINYSIFNLLFIRITIESILDELKNRDDLHCFFLYGQRCIGEY